MTEIKLPDFSLVVLIGASGAGKSTFARRHFASTEIISSDVCRGLVCDDENSMAATADAFDVVHFIAAKRLAGRRLAVIDATNVQPDARKPLIALARRYHCLPVAIVLDMPESVCQGRNAERPDRDFGAHVVRNHRRQLRSSLRHLRREGFRQVVVLKSPEDVDAAVVERRPLWTDRRHDSGPFDIIGDVHGCFVELAELLEKLGYEIRRGDDLGRYGFEVTPPEGRRALFVGDLVDRGPQNPEVLRLVMDMVGQEAALCVPGNHDDKLKRKLRGSKVSIKHGLAETLEQLEAEPEEFKRDVAEFIDRLVSHYMLDQGKLVVAHAGMKQKLQGRASKRVVAFALYGETTGETDEFGLPVRYPWASEYRGEAAVVYGHTPVVEAQWLNNTICVDTGCVFGGKLTALRYPERELVSVEARQTYCEPARPLANPAGSGPDQRPDDVLDIEDVTGKRSIETRLMQRLTIREDNAVSALETMSRFAIDPRWLIYLPPTMSPSATSDQEGYLEHPREALSYFRDAGIDRVICEEKHMGSRAIIVVCKDEAAALERFGASDGRKGVCYTRTGRAFFRDEAQERAVVDRTIRAMDRAGLWEELETDWCALDCEIMPWSAKAVDLLKNQYAPVGSAARAGLGAAVLALTQAATHNDQATALLDDFRHRQDLAGRFVDAYRHYCWTVDSIDDLKVAPFHLLATEARVHTDRDHRWHMQTLERLHQADAGFFIATRHCFVDLADEASVNGAIGWWEEMTAEGGEGMVIKPTNFIEQRGGKLIQPAVKCRGREYLRIIYGPEYTRDEQLRNLRKRHLGKKRSLAQREFSLGLEALERFVRREPLWRVHECVFAVLALESEAVDPRL